MRSFLDAQRSGAVMRHSLHSLRRAPEGGKLLHEVKSGGEEDGTGGNLHARHESCRN